MYASWRAYDNGEGRKGQVTGTERTDHCASSRVWLRQENMGCAEASQESSVVSPGIFCCVKKEREEGDSLVCPRSGVSQVSAAGAQDDQDWWSQKDKASKLLTGTGTCGLC